MIFRWNKKYSRLEKKNSELIRENEELTRMGMRLQKKINEYEKKKLEEKDYFTTNLIKPEHNYNIGNDLEEKVNYINKNFKFEKATVRKNSYKEFISREEAKRWAKNIYSNFSKELKCFYINKKIYSEQFDIRYSTFNQNFSAIEYYTSYDYQNINGLLRRMYSGEYEEIEKYKNLSSLLLLEILLAPRIPDNIITYRLVDESVFINILESLKNNKCYNELGFLSTSLLENINLQTSEHYKNFEFILKIFVNKNTHAVYVSNISGREFEQEIIFPNNALLKPIGDVYYNKKINKIVLECIYSNNVDILN